MTVAVRLFPIAHHFCVCPPSCRVLLWLEKAKAKLEKKDIR
jgi:hypothetical protein